MKLFFSGKQARLKNSLMLLGGLLLLYTIMGFLLMPVVVKHLLISNMQEKLQHEAVLDNIAINPFVFTVELKGFVLKSGSGDTLASVNRFFIDLEAESILNWALTLREITIEEPRLNLIILITL